eukprot:835801_1
MDSRSCKQMVKQCRRGNTVTLMRAWPKNGQDTLIKLCPFAQGTLNRHDRSLVKTADGKAVIIEPIAGGHCKISGEAVQQNIGGICGNDGDCGQDAVCRNAPAAIAVCQK